VAEPTDAIPEDVSDSGLLAPTVVTDNLSNAGKSWYLRGSAGWCILQIYFSLSSEVDPSFDCVLLEIGWAGQERT